MSQAFLEDLEILRPDLFLNAGSGSHEVQTAIIMVAFEKLCQEEKPDLIIVVGDVNSTLACSIKVQRCQAHVARNVLAMAPKKFKKAVADDLRSIFYASTKKKASEFFDKFTDRWEKDLPSAVKCLGTSIDACMTFFNFPEEE
jgi:Transposase, Mutator family/UDP-N-acetylglucosamine 2-epimerase